MNISRIVYIFTATLIWTGLVTTVVFSKSVLAQENAENEEMVELLFVQYAESVTLSEGVLTLKGITPDTLYFSDRPHRIVGRESTQKFVKSWGKGDESFSETPPNAVLAVMQKPVPLDLVVVLKDPVLKGDTLTYQVEVLEGPDSGEGEATALFIDLIDFPLVDAVGRSARETARRIDRGIDDIGDEWFDHDGNSFDDDYDDPDDRDAYRRGYRDGWDDNRYDDDYNDRNEQDAYDEGYEDGERDIDDDNN